MSVLKRITAGLTALSLVAVCTGCKNITTAMTIGDYVVPAGVYLYYLNSAYNTALSQLKEEHEDLDTEDIDAVKASTLEGKDVRTWCEDKAVEFCADFVATETKFDELGLSLDATTKSSIDSMMDYYWQSYEETMTANGISQESFKKVMTSSYKSQEIFDYYYAVGGEEGVTEDELKDYYIKNNIRAQYVVFDLHDGEGNLLKSDDKAKMKKLVEDYQKRADNAYKSGGAEAVMSEMDAIQEDYALYKESVAAEESAAAETADTTVEEDTIIEETVAAQDAPRFVTMEEVTSEEENTTDTTEPSTEEETVDSDADDSADETDETDAEDDTADSDTESETDETADSETADDSATEDETTDSDADTDDDALLEDADAETETEAPYQNENIISVINKEDYDNEEDIHYTPDETVYNKLLEIKEADYGKVYFVEEDESYYLVTRYDITDRMTEEDLWTESAIESASYAKYNKDFEAKMDDWSNALSVTRNAASFKKYDPFEYHF